jgi:hypothetical protein
MPIARVASIDATIANSIVLTPSAAAKSRIRRQIRRSAGVVSRPEIALVPLL